MGVYDKNKVTILVTFKEIIRIGRKQYVNKGEPTEENISKLEGELENDGFKLKNQRNFDGGYFMYWERADKDKHT